MKINKTAILLIVAVFSCQMTWTQNPIIKNIGMSDPHIRVFNDTLYLFTGHDNHPDDKTWVMKDWRVFTSTDLIQWNLATTISPGNNYMGVNSTDCWAGDAAVRNGKYYFYFSDRKRSVGVMHSELPSGPYRDALGKPLVAPMHDPTILTDNDSAKTPYIVYGDKEGGGYMIARLNDDMISLAEAPKPITIVGREWENAPGWMDKNYLFKFQDTYYLSWGRDYAISKNIEGPYQCVGAVGTGHHLNEFAHGSFFWWKGQFYHIWTYYIRPGYKYRECIITYCHFSDDGKIVTDTDFLDKHFETGVGQYNASWPKIQAEWYSEKSEGIKKQGSREAGFELSNISNRSWIKFSNVEFGDKPRLQFRALVSDISDVSQIEIRQDSISGKLLGTARVCPDSNNQVEAICNLKNISGKKDIYLVFSGNTQSLFSLDYFNFEPSDP
jgi:hypothetical protein